MTDALCWDDLDAFGTELNDPIEELRQDLIHRLIEPPGSNLDDPDRGFGLQMKLSGGGKASALAAVTKYGIETEMRKDPRVRDAAANVTETSPGAYRVDVQIVIDEQTIGIALVYEGNSVRAA